MTRQDDYGQGRNEGVYGRSEGVYGRSEGVYGRSEGVYGGQQRQRGPPPPQSDLIFYGDRYQENSQRPQPTNGAASKPQGRRLGDGTYVEYDSNFSPEIFMRETRDFKDQRNRKPQPKRRDQEDRNYEASYDPYNDQYERQLPTTRTAPDERRYPRQDQAFGNSIREEQNALGDYATGGNAYKLNIEGDGRAERGDRTAGGDRDNESQIDYDIFRNQQQQQQQRDAAGDGRPLDLENLENTLGYFP